MSGLYTYNCMSLSKWYGVRTNSRSGVAHLFSALGFTACGVSADTISATWTDRPCRRCQRIVREDEWPQLFRQIVILQLEWGARRQVG